MKALVIAISSIVCLAISLLPEVAMYFTYWLINPSTELGRVLVLTVFWFGGLSVCVFFGFLGFALWISIVSEVSK